jgi:long-chain acyl-CoA synthetase
LGRFKSLLIASDGEKFSPEGIEEAFVDQSPLLDQCILHNNQDPYTIALIVPNKGAILSQLKPLHLTLESEEGQMAALKLIQKELNQYRPGGKHEDLFPNRWLPTAIGILPEAFTEENKLLNSTMKVVRDKVNIYFKEYVDFLYTSEGKNIFNSKNLESLKNS